MTNDWRRNCVDRPLAAAADIVVAGIVAEVVAVIAVVAVVVAVGYVAAAAVAIDVMDMPIVVFAVVAK